MKYRKLLELMLEFISNNDSEKKAESFCNEFMDNFDNFQNDLEQEVTQKVYEMFDDVNMVCDSFESNTEIREMDKYCIDEIILRNKVTEIYEKIVQLTS